MIIESAFFKLLHIWTAQRRDRIYYRQTRLIEPPKFSKEKEVYEVQIASVFANVIRNELSVLGIDIPDRLVIQGYPYPKDKSKQADIYVNLYEFKKKAHIPISYVSEDNFIEVKLFSGKYITKGQQTTTENIGSIINAILRLAFLTGERSLNNNPDGVPSGIPARYLLVLFDSHPKDYISYKTKKRKFRRWIEELLVPLDLIENLRKQKIDMRHQNIGEINSFSYSGTILLNLNDKEEIPDGMFEKLIEGFTIKRNLFLKIPFIKYIIFPLNGSNGFYSFLLRIFEVKSK